MTTEPTVKTRTIVAFVLIAYGLAWLACLPAWLTGGLASPWFGLCASAMMFAPTVAAVVSLRWVERRSWSRSSHGPGMAVSLGLVPARDPDGSKRRIPAWIGWVVLSWALIAILIMAAFAVSAAFGFWRADLVEFSAFRDLLAAQGASADLGLSFPVLVLIQLMATVSINLVITMVFAAGEEIGWRGFLQPALLDRLPRPIALGLGGLIWGLWHAPVILLGYNYGEPVLGLALMVGFCIVQGSLLAWLATRSRSIWPAAVGHAMINGLSSAILLTVSDATQPSDNPTIWGTALGITGWIVPFVAAVVLWTFFAGRTDRAGATR